ncbi:apolipoprotein N-acyltransferase [Candidatus Kirkpatrickella diaphorinae]|uniref:Apolipoprotein N-acyltransferase n=1 Tax=Candidatus Kirkpatrickella diaphorinae TaxID=2984322 RepID=A0ABY6GJ23_9PROT|nr:apolipoprotein N-acyltransferase [Candidatus Kirkpatrickella diaphorinae]UYH50858.1 apolipoprotein N-acyltransferase [Candidatus Kirkpatrickella diaphorinae]
MSGPEASKLRRYRPAFICFLSGLFAATAYPPLYFLPGLICGVWLLYGCARQAASWRQAAFNGLVFGFGLNLGGLYWLTHAVLMGGRQFWWAVPLATPGCALILAPFAAVPSLLARRFSSGWGSILIFAGSWTLADMSRIFLFSGFPWNPLGADLTFPGDAGTVLTQIASVIGVDGLTFCLILTSAALFRVRRSLYVAALLWMFIAIYGYERVHHLSLLPVQNPALVLVQNNVSEDHILSRDESGEVLQRSLMLTREGISIAHALFPDRDAVYAWPESGFPGLLDEAPFARRQIAHAAGGSWGIIGSDRRDEAGQWYNSAMALDGEGEIAATYDKSRLVPFGEYQPRFLPFNIMPGQFRPGPGLRTWQLPQLGRVAPLVCYEVVFSGQVVTNPRPNWMLNLTNDAWFGASAGPWQHLMAVRLRAVEEGVPIAQVANTGLTAIFDAAGRKTGAIPPDKADILVAPLPSPVKKTPFAIFGRSIPIFICLLAFLIALLTIRNARKRKSSEGKFRSPSNLESRSRSHE